MRNWTGRVVVGATAMAVAGALTLGGCMSSGDGMAMKRDEGMMKKDDGMTKKDGQMMDKK